MVFLQSQCRGVSRLAGPNRLAKKKNRLANRLKRLKRAKTGAMQSGIIKLLDFVMGVIILSFMSILYDM